MSRSLLGTGVGEVVMAASNQEIAAVLQEYAELLAITGRQQFKVRVYEKAARAVGGWPTDVSGLDVEELQAIPNVGKSLTGKIGEYVATGSIGALEELRAKVPAGVRALIAIPTLGPKRALELYEELHVTSVAELEEAVRAEKLRGLRGFGAKAEENILHGIELLKHAAGRVPLDTAMDLAERVVGHLMPLDECVRCVYAGSLRRLRETTGDIDVLAASSNAEPLMDAFVAFPEAAEVIAHGPTKTSIRTTAGVQVDLRVVPPEAWGAALVYFTGSKPHNIRIREIAQRAGLKLSEYGLFEVETGDLLVSETEEDVYQRLGLPWIPPTLREDRGEVEAARRGELPTLVTERDIRGDLHTHTDLTDGLASVEDMIAAASARGYRYYAITDHAPNLFMQRMSDEKILAQRERVRKLQARWPRLRLLHGTELNIDPEGGVDWPPEFLAGFDLCVASIHSHFTQPRDRMTRRLVRACENPYVDIIGHPSARLIGKRPPIDVDWDEVFAACARTGTALEINAFPDRLDLSDTLIARALRRGVKFAIDTDAHAEVHLGFLRYGVGTAQRGWVTADDVINTWPLKRLRAFLRHRTAA
jgi:DNA polymerase (family 10)